ncbi:Exosome complex exonuclease RRP44 [Channa argus]|uniref:Protein DIS3 homolog n=1 Tax=Channa argus TaxID=215402 RepID=A0A6G1QZK7_CHAAH|nr:Exosome complex exonuclease RRP44 [Channa argus]
MLKSKTFVKKTRAGGVMKIVREHYLRDDIWCGSEACIECKQESTVLQKDACIESNLCSYPHYLLPDTNVVLHQIDVLEDPVIRNVIILQTVLQEVRHRSAPIYKRLKDIIHEKEKHFYTFTNEHHRDTFIEREPGESANDRNDRAIRVAAKWYSQHLKASESNQEELKVVLLTNDLGNKQKAEESGLLVHKCEEYIKSLIANPELVDRLALSNDDRNETTSSKVLFPEHLPLSRIQAGIKNGSFLQGTFRASRDNYLEATVFVQGEGEDSTEVLIQGLQNLNRAVHQDVVAVELLPRNQWVAPCSLVLQDEGTAKDDNVEEEEEEKALSILATEAARKPTGKVVGIIKRNWRPFCGMLNVSQIKESTRHLFTPADRRVPRIRIETRQSSTLAGQRIMVAIDGWPKDSRYPNGHFVRSLGIAGEKDTEEEVLLLEHDVPHQDFSQAVLSFLPKMPWAITPEDMVRREDLRHLTVCSVDPPGCTDIDDALHCRELENGNLEVGVHIADVSHFIRPGNALDKEAASRGTTVYLCGKRIDMVPELLSSNLCSLRSNVERLAFSCIWEMNHNAEILKTRFTKSVINSKASLTYAEAQMRIDDTVKNDDITNSLRGLNKLAKILKRRRIENGALTLSSLEVRFHIDSETHDPIDLQTKELMETNSMVEEFMLLANISVAQKIYDEFSECALLRKHPAPPPSNYDILLKAGKSKASREKWNSINRIIHRLLASLVCLFLHFIYLLQYFILICRSKSHSFFSLLTSDKTHFYLKTQMLIHTNSLKRNLHELIGKRGLAQIGNSSSGPRKTDKHGDKMVNNNRHRVKKELTYSYSPSWMFILHKTLFRWQGTVNVEGIWFFRRKNQKMNQINGFWLSGKPYLYTDDCISSLNSFCSSMPAVSSEEFIFVDWNHICCPLSLKEDNTRHIRRREHLVFSVINDVLCDLISASEDQRLEYGMDV